MAKKPKADQLSVVGFASAILRNTAQQRSLAKASAKHAAKRDARVTPEQRAAAKKAKKAEKKANKDTRTPEEIGASVDVTRARLVDTVDAVKYDLDVPARLSEVRDRVAAKVPRELRGEPQAGIAAGAVLVLGWGALLWTAIGRSDRPR